MLVLYNGSIQEYDITQVINYQQRLEGVEYRKVYIGQQIGDYEIVSTDYDWGLLKQVNIARCVRCGQEKKISNLADFKRGKGVAQLCKCRYIKEKKIPLNDEYKTYVGQIVNGFRLVDYQKGRGFRAECEQCAKQKWVSGKSALEGNVSCNHRLVRNYSDPKYNEMKVGNLTVVGRVGKLFRFRCDCGTEVVRRPSEVFRIETIKTCGRENCPYHKSMVSTGHIRRLTGVKFEAECATKMEKQGFSVEMLPETGDYGVDFFATVEGKRVAFQCKLLKKESMVSAVQEVYAGGRYYDCCKFVVVSPSGFTYPAELMASKLGVQLEKDLQNFRLKTMEENKINTQKMQMFSRGGLIWELDGVAKPANAWCQEYGISRAAVVSRLEAGVDLKTALTAPKYVRRDQLIEIDGEAKTKKEWCDIYGISPQTYDYRIKYSGLSPKEALTKPRAMVGRKKKEEM